MADNTRGKKVTPENVFFKVQNCLEICKITLLDVQSNLSFL